MLLQIEGIDYGICSFIGRTNIVLNGLFYCNASLIAGQHGGFTTGTCSHLPVMTLPRVGEHTQLPA